MKKLDIFLVTFIFLLDQSVKFLLRSLNYPLVTNRGISFGLAREAEMPQAVFIIVYIVLLGIIIFLRHKTKSKMAELGLLLIISGGLSNLSDRIVYQAVIDYIDIRPFPVFNLADVAITIGVLTLLLSFLRTQESIQ